MLPSLFRRSSPSPFSTRIFPSDCSAIFPLRVSLVPEAGVNAVSTLPSALSRARLRRARPLMLWKAPATSTRPSGWSRSWLTVPPALRPTPGLNVGSREPSTLRRASAKGETPGVTKNCEPPMITLPSGCSTAAVAPPVIISVGVNEGSTMGPGAVVATNCRVAGALLATPRALLTVAL